MSSVSRSVREQYERFPYPPVPWMALPDRRAISLSSGPLSDPLANDPKSILVAGGGTLEPAVVAMAFPRAERVVAVDISQKSLQILSWRLRLMRTLRFYQKVPHVELVQGDLLEWEPQGSFDLVLATNVLHHTDRPADLLMRLTRWLRPSGRLRLVTYPRGSRIWIREVSRYLRDSGIDPYARDALSRSKAACLRLAEDDPVRSAFFAHGESGDATGLVDAFFHACERPLWPLEWKRVFEAAGLRLVGERQDPLDRSSFLDGLLPNAASLDPFTKLDVLDAALELTASPVLWLEKTGEPTAQLFGPEPPRSEARNLWLRELKEAVARIDTHLASVGSNAEALAAAIARECGAGERPGLSFSEYDLGRIRRGDAAEPRDVLLSTHPRG